MSNSKAFIEWWAKDMETRDETEPLVDRYERAYNAGIQRAVALVLEGKQVQPTERKGSDLRGRIVIYHRPLWPNEIARENEDLAENTHWPCLELDDGTLVYPATEPKDGYEPLPGVFYGYKPHMPEGKRKVHFHAEVIGIVKGE